MSTASPAKPAPRSSSDEGSGVLTGLPLTVELNELEDPAFVVLLKIVKPWPFEAKLVGTSVGLSSFPVYCWGPAKVH